MLLPGLHTWHRLIRSRLSRSTAPSRRRKFQKKRRSGYNVSALVEILEDRTLLAAFTVDIATDELDVAHGGSDVDTGLSLREAIVAANDLAGDDTITLPAGIYTLRIVGAGEDEALTGDLDITDTTGSLTITGISAGTTIIDAGGDTGLNDRVFHVLSGAILNVSEVTVTGGVATVQGGGLLNAGTMTLANSIVSGNTADVGGGIFNNRGTLTISNSTLSGNSAVGDGGGIRATGGTLTISNSTMSFNSAGGLGGGIRARGGTLTISDSTLSGNTANIAGGGIFNQSLLTVKDSTLSGNSAEITGGIDNQSSGVLTITNSVLSGNTATAPLGTAGGVSNRGTLSISNTTLSGNSASGHGGGIWNMGMVSISNSSLVGNSAGASSGFGGGILNADNGSVELSNTTLSGNTANQGGGIFNGRNSMMLSVNNSTLSGNKANVGGGILNRGTVTVTSSTLTENAAIAAGGIFNEGFFGATFNFGNTILADNTAIASGPNQINTSGAIINSQGFNLVGDNTGFVFTAAVGDLVGTATSPIDPLLGPLQDNGGSTLTHALLPGSPAIDAASFTDASGDPVTTDQRGIARPQGVANDIGAFEVEVTNAPPVADAGGSYAVGEGSEIQLDASGSTDPDLPDDILTYAWDLDGDDIFGETGTDATRGDEVGINPNLSAAGLDGPSSVVVGLRVTDDGGLTSTDTATITVNNVAPVADDATFEVVENSINGTSVGSVSASDPGNDTLTYNITGGNGSTAFEINADTGEITVADATQLDFETTPIFTVEVTVADDDGETDIANVTINLLNQASISGTVYVDVDQDGFFDANEPGIDGVAIELLDESGTTVLDTVYSSDGGFFLFEDLDSATYRLREVQPTGVDDGAESLGSLGGIVVSNDTMELTLNRIDASDYVFAELGQDLTSGDTASIGFWQNKHGQALINAGGDGLKTWLSASFANVFGNVFDSTSVADFYKQELFKQKSTKSSGPAKVDAQFMATAMATYFTSSTLAGTVAADYGFNVSETGIGTNVVNVGSNGAAFSVADGSNLTILQLLLATNSLTDDPDDILGAAKIYDTNGDGVIDAAEAALRTKANTLYAFINEE